MSYSLRGARIHVIADFYEHFISILLLIHNLINGYVENNQQVVGGLYLVHYLLNCELFKLDLNWKVGNIHLAFDIFV